MINNEITLQEIIPHFNQDAIDNKLLQVAAVPHEVFEVTWLRAIQTLTKADLGIEDTLAFTKFKAIMVLHAHQIFYYRQKWREDFQSLLGNLVLQKLFMGACNR